MVGTILHISTHGFAIAVALVFALNALVIPPVASADSSTSVQPPPVERPPAPTPAFHNATPPPQSRDARDAPVENSFSPLGSAGPLVDPLLENSPSPPAEQNPSLPAPSLNPDLPPPETHAVADPLPEHGIQAPRPEHAVAPVPASRPISVIPPPPSVSDPAAAASQNDCGLGRDAANAYNLADRITLPVDCTGWGHSGTDVWDFYKIEVTEEDTEISAIVGSPSADMDICLRYFDPATGEERQARCGNAPFGQDEQIVFKPYFIGDYLVEIFTFSGDGNYRLAMARAAAQDDCRVGSDAGGNFVSASRISLPANSCSGAFPSTLPADVEDWYKFGGGAGHQVTVLMTPSGGDFNLCLYRPDETQARCSTFASGAESILFTLDADGDWFIRVYVQSGRGTYTLSAETRPPQNDCNTGQDAGGSFSSANAVTLPASCNGLLERTDSDTEDWYKLSLGSGGSLTASMTPSSPNDFDVCLYSPANVQIRCSTLSGSVAESFTASITASGDHRLRIYSVGTSSGTYSLSITYSGPPPPNDCGSGTDAGDTFSGATAIFPPISCIGSFPSSGESNDYYKFTVTVSQIISASMTPPAGADFDLCLYNPAGMLQGCSSTTGSSRESIALTADSSGSWRIRVSKFSGSGAYSMAVSLSIVHDDCGTRTDAGNTFSAAMSRALPSDCRGGFPKDTGDSEDWYSFDVSTGETIAASLSMAGDADFDLCLYTPDNTLAKCSARAGSGFSEAIEHTLAAAGKWRLRAFARGGTGTTYFLHFNSFIPQNDCGTSWDAGNHRLAAIAVIPPKSCDGSFPIGTAESEDWYVLDVASGEGIQVHVTPQAGRDVDLCIYGPDGAEIQCSRTRGGSSEALAPTATSTGSWYVRLIAVTGRGNYTMGITLLPAQDDCGTGTDAGASHSFATHIGTPAACSGAFPTTGFDWEDWYKFPVSSNTAIVATLTPQVDADFDLCLHKPNGEEVQCSRFHRDATESVSATATLGGEWRLRVQVRSSMGEGTYSLSVTITAPHNDCLTGTDAGGSFSQATPINPPVTNCLGGIASSSGDKEDWYKFSVPAYGLVHASLQPATTNLDLCLYRPDNSLASCGSLPGTSKETVSGAPIATTGEWRLRVYNNPSGGDYTLSVALTAPEDDCGTGGDAGSSSSYAASLATPAQCSAEFRSPDTEDWYGVLGEAGKALNIVMTPNAGADYDVCLYDIAGWNELLCSTLQGNGVSEAISHTIPSSGTYHLRVFVRTGTGSYSLTVTSETAQDDCGTRSDAGNTHAKATAIASTGLDCQGAFPGSTGDHEDWYRVRAEMGGAIDVVMTPHEGLDFDLCVYAPHGDEVACSATYGGDAERLSVVLPTSGDWRIRVNSLYHHGGGGSYTLRVAVASAQSDCGASGDAGNTREAARFVGLPSTCHGSFPSDWADREDWYSFSLAYGSVLNALLTPEVGNDLDLCIYGLDGTEKCATLTGATSESINYPAVYSGTYYARVYLTAYSGTGHYELALKTVPPQNDCGTGGDAGGGSWEASSISPPVTCQGDMRLEEGDREDWYLFSAYEGQSLEIMLTPYATGADLDVCLYRPGENLPAKCSTFTNVNTESLTYTIGMPGNWSIRVYQVSGSTVYDLSVQITSLAPNDCATYGEAGNTFATATPVYAPFSCTGEFRPNSGDKEDWYKFTAQAGNALTATLTPPAGADFELCLYRPDGAQAGCSATPGSLRERLSITAGQSGSWRLRVVVVSSYGTYSLTLEAPLPAGDDYTYFDFNDVEEWSTTGLWRQVYKNESAYALSYSAPGAYWFGRPDRGTYEDGLTATSGTLTSPPISLLGVPNPMLGFASWYQTEDTGGVHDAKRVQVSVDGGTTWTLLDNVEGDADYERWAIRYIDMSAYSGYTVKIRFEFDTSDAFHNAYRGWYVDDVRIFRDDDHDGLYLEEENAVGSDPSDSDTDDDGVVDGGDWRPTVEDIRPFFPYPPGTTLGEIKFYPDQGFVDVDLKPPTDNAGGGIEGVDFSLALEGIAGGESTKATVRFDLLKNATTGNYQGRFPLPRNFANGRATSEEIVITVHDVNGNREGYSGSAQEVLEFTVPWNGASDPDFHSLRSASIEDATAGVTSFRTSVYSIDPLARGQQAASVPYFGVVGPGQSDHFNEFEVTSPRSGGSPVPLPIGGTMENVLSFVGSQFQDRPTTMAFAGGAFNTVWDGVKWGWENLVKPEVQSFVFGSDSNGRYVGDFIAGLIGIGDVRDIIIGAYTGDSTKVLMGAVGLALTFTVVGDIAFNAAKVAAKVAKPAIGRAIAKSGQFATKQADKLDDLLGRLARIGKYVGADEGKSARLTRFSNLYGDADPALLKLSRELDDRGVDKAFAKHGDDQLGKFTQTASRIATPEHLVGAAVAEAKVGGSIVNDMAEMAGSEGIEVLSKHIQKNAGRANLKGYQYQLQKAAAFKRQPDVMKVVTEKKFRMDDFVDSAGVRHPKTPPFESDIIVQKTDGTVFIYETKAKNALKNSASNKNQVLKMERLLKKGGVDENGVTQKFTGGGIILKDNEYVSPELLRFARDHGVPFFDDLGNLLN